MREIDRDFHSKLLVRRDAAVGALSDLEGKALAVGSVDSAHARILPLHFLRQAGVAVEKIQLLPFEVDVGKHGDTATSEVQALAALHEGKAQAAAVGDAVWLAEQANGHIDLRGSTSSGPRRPTISRCSTRCLRCPRRRPRRSSARCSA